VGAAPGLGDVEIPGELPYADVLRHQQRFVPDGARGVGVTRWGESVACMDGVARVGGKPGPRVRVTGPRGRGMRKRAMTSVKAGASPACPAVRWKASGRHRSSAARWIFMVSPPRDRPMAWTPGSPAGAPFASPCRMLVSAHDRGVHRDNPVEVFVGVGLGHQRGEHPLPGAVNGPHPQPVVDAPPVAVLLRQMHPLGAGLELEGDRVDHLPMITPATTPSGRPVREHRLDPRPLRITQRHTRTNDQSDPNETA
jgi:hypothetical protein